MDSEASLTKAPPVTADSATKRAFRLLDYISGGGATANLSEVARATNISRLTVMRLLVDLEEAGIVHKRSTGSYKIDIDFLRIAARAMAHEDLHRLGRRVLGQLSSQLQLSAYLVVPNGKDILYLLREVPQLQLVSNVSIGSVVPAHLMAPGRVILAQLSESELRELLGPFPLATVTEHSPSTFEQLELLLAEHREQGCAWSQSGFEAGIDACAAVVLGPDGRAKAAISVAGPSERFRNDEGLRERTQSAVIESAQTLTTMLGAV